MMDQMTKILYVDDEPINLQVFKMNFKKKYNILLAESGSEGLDMLENDTSIKVVISDMKMPGMDGYEFIVNARKNYPNLTYFILTGFDITDEISKALQEGIIHKYFSKPFNMRDIEACLPI